MDPKWKMAGNGNGNDANAEKQWKMPWPEIHATEAEWERKEAAARRRCQCHLGTSVTHKISSSHHPTIAHPPIPNPIPSSSFRTSSSSSSPIMLYNLCQLLLHEVAASLHPSFLLFCYCSSSFGLDTL